MKKHFAILLIPVAIVAIGYYFFTRKSASQPAFSAGGGGGGGGVGISVTTVPQTVASTAQTQAQALASQIQSFAGVGSGGGSKFSLPLGDIISGVKSLVTGITHFFSVNPENVDTTTHDPILQAIPGLNFKSTTQSFGSDTPLENDLATFNDLQDSPIDNQTLNQFQDLQNPNFGESTIYTPSPFTGSPFDIGTVSQISDLPGYSFDHNVGEWVSDSGESFNADFNPFADFNPSADIENFSSPIPLETPPTDITNVEPTNTDTSVDPGEET